MTAEQSAWARRLMTVRPWVLFGMLIVAPVAAIVAAFLTPVAQSPRWMMLAFGFVGAAQWTAFLSWEWVVATRMVAIVGERRGIRTRLFKLTYVSMVLIFVLFLVSVLWMQDAAEGVELLLAVAGNACYIYGLCFLASVVTRADLGATARFGDVLLTAAGLFFLSFIGVCLLQRRVNRVYRRMYEAS